MTHEQYEENVGAYLLGALPELERQAFEQHLERCSDCRSALDHLRPAAEALPRAAAPLTPPPRLKEALMEVVEREAAAPDPKTSADARRRGRPPAESRSRRFWQGRPAFAWAGAALLIALGTAAGFGLAEGLSDESPQRLAVQVDEGRLPPGASAQLVVTEGGTTAVLQTNSMPSLTEGSVYQLWLERDGSVIPQSLFQVDSDGRGAGVVTDGVEGADAVMVTREPAGGSPAPTEAPVLTVEL